MPQAWRELQRRPDTPKGGLVEHMAVGQSQWYHFRVGAPLILVYFIGDWDVHWGYGILTHGHMSHEVTLAVGNIHKVIQEKTPTSCPEAFFSWLGQTFPVAV